MSVELQPPGTTTRTQAMRWIWVLGGFIALAGIVFRVIHLDADPAWRLWGHHVTDEGRWTEQARRLVLFGEMDMSHWIARLHFLLAPLFQASTWVVFSIFGPGFATARAVSAFSGILLMAVGGWFAYRRFDGVAALATLLILALQPELVHLSRAGIPEMAALCFSFLSFATVLSPTRSRPKLFAAGILTLIAAGFKATVAPLAPALALIAAVTRPDGEPRRLEASAWYLAGLAVPVGLLPIALLATGHGFDLLSEVMRQAAYFVRLDDSYGALARYFYSPAVAALGPLFLASWILAGLIIPSGRVRDGLAGDAYLGSAIWVVGLLTASSAFAYFPDRYVLHVLVPLAVNIGAGMSLLRNRGMDGVRDALEHVHGSRRILVALWLSAPVAWLLGPSGVAAAEIAGLEWTRLRHHLTLLLALTAVVTWFVWRTWQARRLLWLAGLSLLAVAFQVLLAPAGVGSGAFWRPSALAGLLGGVAVLALAAAALAVAHGRTRGALAVAVPVFVALVVGFWLSRELRFVLAPTYTAREAATAIEELVPEGAVVGTVDAAGVLLPTRIRYIEHLRSPPHPDLFLEFKPVSASFLDEYTVIGEWDLNVRPYQFLWGDGRIVLYRRSDRAPTSPAGGRVGSREDDVDVTAPRDRSR